MDVKSSSPSSDPQNMLKEAYTITLTHTALLLQQVELLRKAIEVDAAPKNLLEVQQLDPIRQRSRTEAALQAITEAEDNVEKLRKNLRKSLSAVGIRSSNSSEESTCTSGHPSPVSSPSLHHKAKHPLGSPALTRVKKPSPLPRKKRLQISTHLVVPNSVPVRTPEEPKEEDQFYQNVTYNHRYAMQETNAPSDDPKPVCCGNTSVVYPVEARSVVDIRLDSRRQRSQSHSGTDDSPRMASHRKSLSQDESKRQSMISEMVDSSNDFTGGTDDSGYADREEWQITTSPTLDSESADSEQQLQYADTQETHHYTTLLHQTRDEPSDYTSIKHES